MLERLLVQLLPVTATVTGVLVFALAPRAEPTLTTGVEAVMAITLIVRGVSTFD